MLFAGAVLVFSACLLRTYERTTPQSEFESFWNNLWVLLVTQTTVGYGDLIPRTHLGRGFTMIFCMCGTFMISYFVVSTGLITALESAELRFLSFFLNKLKTTENLRPTSAVVIQRWWRFILKRRQREPRVYQIWLFKKGMVKFTLKHKKLLAEETESVGSLIDHFVKSTSKALKKVELNLERLKKIKTTQAASLKLQGQVEGKLKAYEAILRKVAEGRGVKRPCASTTGTQLCYDRRDLHNRGKAVKGVGFNSKALSNRLMADSTPKQTPRFSQVSSPDPGKKLFIKRKNGAKPSPNYIPLPSLNDSINDERPSFPVSPSDPSPSSRFSSYQVKPDNRKKRTSYRD